MRSLRLVAVVVVRIVRWWFGGPILVALGWVVHPWGLQRAMNGQPLLPLQR